MEHEQKIVQEVEKTLDLLDRAERVKLNPFFYSRLQAQIDTQKSAQSWKLLPGVLKPVFLALLLIYNIFTAVYFLNSGQKSSIRSELKSEFAQEYGLDTNTDDYLLIQ